MVKTTRVASWHVGLSPPTVLALLYAALTLIGTAFLLLPAAATAQPLDWSEALFTATSAVTVTGLIVVETGSDLSFFGQAVVLVLIQLGGLGLMTFATLVLTTLGLPIGFEQRQFLKEDLGRTSLSDLLELVRMIIKVVIACELAGTVLLALVTVPEFGLWPRLWQALFHAVSAFNNAGLMPVSPCSPTV